MPDQRDELERASQSQVPRAFERAAEPPRREPVLPLRDVVRMLGSLVLQGGAQVDLQNLRSVLPELNAGDDEFEVVNHGFLTPRGIGETSLQELVGPDSQQLVSQGAPTSSPSFGPPSANMATLLSEYSIHSPDVSVSGETVSSFYAPSTPGPTGPPSVADLAEPSPAQRGGRAVP